MLKWISGWMARAVTRRATGFTPRTELTVLPDISRVTVCGPDGVRHYRTVEGGCRHYLEHVGAIDDEWEPLSDVAIQFQDSLETWILDMQAENARLRAEIEKVAEWGIVPGPPFLEPVCGRCQRAEKELAREKARHRRTADQKDDIRRELDGLRDLQMRQQAAGDAFMQQMPMGCDRQSQLQALDGAMRKPGEGLLAMLGLLGGRDGR